MTIIGPGTTASRPIERLTRPFQEFAARETSGGILLLLSTLTALVWANSLWAKSYFALWHTTVGVGFSGFTLSRDLHFWVNDGLMALFFFVVGLEIKRELLVGELASPRQAALPIAAAIGGVLVPALVYSALNIRGPGAPGWGIPMATDIAFVIGVMALLGRHVPMGLKVFLTALAIVDDIAAVLVIAFFYTAQIAWGAIAVASICVVALLAVNRLAVRHPLPYALLGLLLWLAVLRSGVHATIAGVLLAMTIPSRTELNPSEFLLRSRTVLDHFERTAHSEKTVMNDDEQQAAIDALEDSCEQVQPLLHRLEHGLHPWVTFLVMPVFALANAGVAFRGDVFTTLVQPVPLGVVLGLLLGKPAGITLASWLAVRSRLGSLPDGITWVQIHGAGWLGGIGFTMSIFVAGLAFKDEAMLNMAKLGIFTASLLAGIVGSVFLLRKSSMKIQENEQD
jgi:NhaA family Na+:H+ antiporter